MTGPVIETLRALLGESSEIVVTSRQVRDAMGQPALSVDSVGRILGGLGLRKVRNSQRRGWLVTLSDVVTLTSVTSVTEKTPVIEGQNATERTLNEMEELNELQKENETLRALMGLVAGGREKPKTWYKVTNLTTNWIHVPHPERPHSAVDCATLGPHEVRVVDGDVFDDSRQGHYNRDLERLGYIGIEDADGFDTRPKEDRGRRLAFSEDVKLADPDLEFLAGQVLLFAGDTLPDEIAWSSDGHASNVGPAVVVKAIIEASPHRATSANNKGPKDWRYLAEIQRPMLANVLEREKLWRNRPAIVAALEKRIAELGEAVLLSQQGEATQVLFEQKMGGGGIRINYG